MVKYFRFENISLKHDETNSDNCFINQTKKLSLEGLRDQIIIFQSETKTPLATGQMSNMQMRLKRVDKHTRALVWFNFTTIVN